MATKKKSAVKRTTKAPAKAKSSVRATSIKSSKQAFNDRTIQLLVVCFTFLSLTFAVMAYWRYV
ncbi:MAG TPA: hypothetical protein VKQ34_02055 [Candidatus Saccharimonadales bacterium]|nr:hypothetical protein [Candidatus Saccharimonadales bacterium]